MKNLIKLMVGLLLSAVLVMTVVGCGNPVGGDEVAEATLQDLIGTWKTNPQDYSDSNKVPPQLLARGYYLITFTADTYKSVFTVELSHDDAYPVNREIVFGPYKIERSVSDGQTMTVTYSGVINGRDREHDITMTFIGDSKKTFKSNNNANVTAHKQE